MRITGLALASLLLLTIGALSARGEEVTVVRDVLGPEGPLVVDGNLYYVAWTSGTLSRWDGKAATVLNDAKGCSHNGLALTKQRTFLLACSDEKGAILELDLAGKLLHRWDADDRGRPMTGGINDVVVTGNGSAYATVFGPFRETPADVVGKVLYMAPGSGKWVEVASGINYANGVGISPDQKTLYVSAMVGNTLLKFTVQDDGSLSHPMNFAVLSSVAPIQSTNPWLGPDSMKVDGKGNLYVAQWAGGRILKLSPEGKLLHVFPIAAGLSPTNVAFTADEKELYVTVVKDPLEAEGRGSIVRIPNVP